jgi:hypothetical protein
MSKFSRKIEQEDTAQSVNDAQLSKLAAVVDSLGAGEVRKLAAAIERNRLSGQDKLPYVSLLDSLRPALRASDAARVPTPLRLFCKPFEGLLISGKVKTKLAGRISRAAIAPVWAWLADELMPDRHAELTAGIARHILHNNPVAAADMTATLHVEAATAIRSAISGLDREDPDFQRLVLRLGGETELRDAEEMAKILRQGRRFEALCNSLPKPPIDNVNEPMIHDFKEICGRFGECLRGGSKYGAVIIMGRLTQPWQILRLARTYEGTMDDTRIKRTELAYVGDLLSEEVSDVADAIRKETDRDKLVLKLSIFVAQFTGVTAELQIQKQGELGRRLLSARAKVAKAVEPLIRRSYDAIEEALPRHKVRSGRRNPGRPDLSRPIDGECAERAKSVSMFFQDIRPLAGKAAFSMTLNETIATLTEDLHYYGNQLVEVIRRGDDLEFEQAWDYLRLTADILEPIDRGAAEVLRRRAAAAEVV